MGCCSLLARQWRDEPWGYPARPQAAILSLKFPTSVKPQDQPLLTRIYRLLFCTGWSFWVFYSALGVHVETGPDWCIYVTNWTAALMGGYTWAALLAVLLPRVQWLDRAAWFLHSVAAPLTIMVTILYWATFDPTETPDITTYHTHGVNASLMLFDVTLSRYPYQLKHFPAPLAFITTYLIFNRIYYAATAVVVYPSLNYGKNLGLALAMIAATVLVLLPGTHLLLWRHELACFSLSERLRRRRRAQAAAQEAADGAVKKGAAGTGAAQLELSNAVLARRWMGEADDDEAVVQTPTTTGSAASPAGRGDDDSVDVEAAAPTGVIGA